MALTADEWLDAYIVGTTGPEEASLGRALVIVDNLDF